MPSVSVSGAAGFASILVALFVWFRKSKPSAASLPPGPKPVPLLGNIRDLTAKELWLPAAQWAKQYGEREAFLDISDSLKLSHRQATLYIYMY